MREEGGGGVTFGNMLCTFKSDKDTREISPRFFFEDLLTVSRSLFSIVFP